MLEKFSSGILKVDPDTYKEKWMLQSDIAYLNHGSFGATPKQLLAHQQELQRKMESEPVQFMMETYPKAQWEAKIALGKLVQANPEDIALIENATSGVNAVLRSIDFHEGDEVLFVDQVYGACRTAARQIVEKQGGVCRSIEMRYPISDSEEITKAVCEAWSSKVKLLLFDQICSPTGWVLPAEKIVEFYESRGTMVLVDGAHCVGQIPLRLHHLGASFYVSNAHKWLCAPKGVAFLYARKDRQNFLYPTTLSHHANYDDSENKEPSLSRFQLAFSWTGTRDPTAFMSLSQSISFMESLHPEGLDGLMRENSFRARKFAQFLRAVLGEELLVPETMIGSMCSIFLPEGIDLSEVAQESLIFGQDPLWLLLYKKYGIEAMVLPFQGRRLLRVSIQAYVTDDDLNRLVGALGELLKK